MKSSGDNLLLWGLYLFVVAIAAIAALIYSFPKSKPKKFAWTEQDGKLTSGCIATIILNSPWIYLTIAGVDFVNTRIAPRLNTEDLSGRVIHLLLIMAAFVMAAYTATLIDKIFTRWLGFWRRLHELDKQGKKIEAESHETVWSKRFKRLGMRFKRQ